MKEASLAAVWSSSCSAKHIWWEAIQPFTIQTLIQQGRLLTGTSAADWNQRQKISSGRKQSEPASKVTPTFCPLLLQPWAWLWVPHPQRGGKPTGPSRWLLLLCCCPVECYHYDNLQVYDVLGSGSSSWPRLRVHGSELGFPAPEGSKEHVDPQVTLPRLCPVTY